MKEKAEGFSDAATQVMTAIEKYLVDKNIDTSTVKFWLTGYSRGGATANIHLAKVNELLGQDNVGNVEFSSVLSMPQLLADKTDKKG